MRKKMPTNSIVNAEDSETAHWNRYKHALKGSQYAFKAWQKSTYRLRAAIRAEGAGSKS